MSQFTQQLKELQSVNLKKEGILMTKRELKFVKDFIDSFEDCKSVEVQNDSELLVDTKKTRHPRQRERKVIRGL